MAEVAVVKCENYDNSVFDSVSKAFDLIKAKDMLKKNMKVLIKPNILASTEPSKAVTTHPLVIDAICSYLNDLNVKLYIGESSGSAATHGTKQAFKKSGIEEVAKKHGAEFINFDEDEHIIRKNNDAVVMKNVVMSKKLSEIDLIIDACKLKTHMLSGYTGAVKNMFGILPGRAKVNAHAKGKKLKTFCNILLDVYSALKPGLCIMDGIVGMEGNGPSSGKIKKTGLIITSKDAVALDIIASKIIGFKFNELEFLKLAKKRGLVPKEINVLGLQNVTVHYKKPLSYRFGYSWHIHNFATSGLQASFVVNKDKCKRCGYCIKACPQKAIKPTDAGYPFFDKSKCIMCYCCHELCPHDAIILKKPLIARIAERFRKRYSD